MIFLTIDLKLFCFFTFYIPVCQTFQQHNNAGHNNLEILDLPGYLFLLAYLYKWFYRIGWKTLPFRDSAILVILSAVLLLSS